MRAMVTGVSRGIGRSICLEIVRDAKLRGEDVTLAIVGTGKSEDLANNAEELKGMGVRCIALAADLSDADRCVSVTEEAIDFCGGLDALVHNAGFPLTVPLLATRVPHWDKMFAVNVRALMLLGRAAHPALSQSRGSICATASIASQHPGPGSGGYSASKAAEVMLIQEMAIAWGPDGIRANAVSPGMTYSRSTARVYDDPERRAQREAIVPLRRLGRPEDIGAAVAFLVGPNAQYITGVNLNVDGGLILESPLPDYSKVKY